MVVMSFRNMFGSSNCDNKGSLLVDNMIGSAFDIVKSVADNLKYILHVSTNLVYIVDITEFKQRLATSTLGLVGQTILVPLPAEALVLTAEVINVSVNLKKETGELYPEKDCPISVIVRNGNIEVTLNADANVSFEEATIYCRVSFTS
jgi:hypothetical protein